MIAFLTSSPCIPNADRAILNPENGFVDRMRTALPPRPKCLFICSHPDSAYLTDKYAADMDEAFSGAGMPFGSLTVLDSRNDERAAEMIAQSDFIILAGGHVPTQNAYFARIGLREMLAGYRGVLMGVSAGSMNAADEVYVQPELAGESSPEFCRWATGLGLTHTNLLPHYQQIRDWYLDGKRLFEDITFADSMGHSFYALVDGSYLCIENGREELIGECWRIADGRMVQMGWKAETPLENGGKV